MTGNIAGNLNLKENSEDISSFMIAQSLADYKITLRVSKESSRYLRLFSVRSNKMYGIIEGEEENI